MNPENENSSFNQHLLNGESDFNSDSPQCGRVDSSFNENKSFEDAKDLVSGASSHHIEESISRPKPPSNLQLSQEPKVYSPATSASTTVQSSQGFSSTAPLRRVDNRAFQPAPPQRPQNPLNFQPSQNWNQRSSTGQFSPVEYRPPPQQFQPNNQQYQSANQQYQGQYQSNQQYQPRAQFQQAPTSTADSTRKLSSFSPSSPTSPLQTSAPSPRPVVPGALNLRRASPWSLLREKFPPSDLTRPRLRAFQYQPYNSMNPQPVQSPPPPPPASSQIQQDRKPENEQIQRSYLPQEPANKNIDMMRVRSPMMQNSGRDSPTMAPPQFTSPTPGQGAPSPRPPVPPMQRTDSMSAMRGDPRLQQPYAPRPPRSPNKFDDDDVVMGDPRMALGRGSPRPPVPFNKFQGQDLPKNMTPPPGEPVKYMTRPETPDRSSPMNQTYVRSPIPNNYQTPPMGTPTPPNYGTPKTSSPMMMSSSPQSYLSKSPIPPSTDPRSSHDSPNMMSGKSTPEQMSRTPEVPKASSTPLPPAPTKPPEVPTKPPENFSRSSTPSDRPSTPSKMSPQSSNDRPTTIRRSPSGTGRDTPFFNGVSSENSSGRTSRTESSHEGMLNNKNLEKSIENRSTPQHKRMISSSKSKDGDHDSGVDESTQGNEATTNGDIGSPKKSPTKIPAPKKLSMTSPTKTPTKTTPKTPEAPDKKKVPMNKVQVGAAPSPNLKTVRSKIGSLGNASYKPGGGKVKIENRKLDWKAQPRIAAKNDTYTPGGGDKKETQPEPITQTPVVMKAKKLPAPVSKNLGSTPQSSKNMKAKNVSPSIQQVKLQWNAKSKIGSLENATHKPGGGDKKIESVKLDFKDKAKPKIGSKDNMKHIPGGGTVKNSEENGEPPKIEDQKLEIKASSKIGSLDNVKHRPGGGDKKIFDDKEYLKQMGVTSKPGSEGPSGTQEDEGTSAEPSRNCSRHTSRSRERRQLSQSNIVREDRSPNRAARHISRKSNDDTEEPVLNEANNNGVSPTGETDDMEEELAVIKKEEEEEACVKDTEDKGEREQEKEDTQMVEESPKVVGEDVEVDEAKNKTSENNSENDGVDTVDENQEKVKEVLKEGTEKIDADENETQDKKGGLSVGVESLQGEETEDMNKVPTQDEKTVDKQSIDVEKQGELKVELKTLKEERAEDKNQVSSQEEETVDKQSTEEVENQELQTLKEEGTEDKNQVSSQDEETVDKQSIEEIKKQEEEDTKVITTESSEKDGVSKDKKEDEREYNSGIIKCEGGNVDTRMVTGTMDDEGLDSVVECKGEEVERKAEGNLEMDEKKVTKVDEDKIDEVKDNAEKTSSKSQSCEKESKIEENMSLESSDSVKKEKEEKQVEKNENGSSSTSQIGTKLENNLEGLIESEKQSENFSEGKAIPKDLDEDKIEKKSIERSEEIKGEEITKTKEEMNEVEIKEVDCKEIRNISKESDTANGTNIEKSTSSPQKLSCELKNENKSPEKQIVDTTKQVTDLTKGDTEKCKITEKPTQFDTNMIKTLEIGSNQNTNTSKSNNKSGVLDGKVIANDKNEIKSSALEEANTIGQKSDGKSDLKEVKQDEEQNNLKSNVMNIDDTSKLERSAQNSTDCDGTDSKIQGTNNSTNGNSNTST